MHLIEKERITILMMRGFGDKIRSYQEVVHLFNDTFDDRPPISKSTVYRTVDRFERTGSIKDEPKFERPKDSTNDDKSLEVLLATTENPHTSVSKVAQQNEICKRSTRRILKKYHYHPYKIHFVQELFEEDFDRRLEFCV
jgi:transposase